MKNALNAFLILLFLQIHYVITCSTTDRLPLPSNAISTTIQEDKKHISKTTNNRPPQADWEQTLQILAPFNKYPQLSTKSRIKPSASKVTLAVATGPGFR